MGFNRQTAQGPDVKRGPLLFAVSGIAALLLSASGMIRERLIWNRTASLPQGLYWVSQDAFGRGDMVAVSEGSEAAQWAARHGFTGPGWPLLKEVSGMPGDLICRENVEIFINGKRVGTALVSAQNGVRLPRWAGCRTLADGEVFLLNAHPQSLDGRYFGVTQASDIDGRAIRVLAVRQAR